MILVTGASGFVGGKILKECKNVLACPSLQGKTQEQIKKIVLDSGADTIIHTAAISDVGLCQAHPDESYIANVLFPLYLAKASKDIKLICFSSDQVYGGAKEDGPYTEDMAKPNNVYAMHKQEMEQRVLEIAPKAVMLRAEWMYDYYLKKSNYFMNIINAKDKVSFSSRQYRGITYVKEVVQNMEKVISLPGGVYNFGSETTKSMYEITKEFLALIGKEVSLEDANPRHNLWLNCDKIKSYGICFKDVESALIECAKDYGFISK